MFNRRTKNNSKKKGEGGTWQEMGEEKVEVEGGEYYPQRIKNPDIAMKMWFRSHCKVTKKN